MLSKACFFEFWVLPKLWMRLQLGNMITTPKCFASSKCSFSFLNSAFFSRSIWTFGCEMLSLCKYTILEGLWKWNKVFFLIFFVLKRNWCQHQKKFLWYYFTLSTPNYSSILIETQILRNLWGICKNAQLGSNLGSNQLSNELFWTKNGIVNKKYHGLN